MVANRPEIQQWIRQAERHLNSAKVLLEAGEHAQCVFHCHQTIEMGLKAILMILLEDNAPYTHSLVKLGEQTNSLQQFDSLFRELTTAYTDARYPGASEESPDAIYGGERSERLFNQTSEFFKWLKTETSKISPNS